MALELPRARRRIGSVLAQMRSWSQTVTAMSRRREAVGRALAVACRRELNIARQINPPLTTMRGAHQCGSAELSG